MQKLIKVFIFFRIPIAIIYWISSAIVMLMPPSNLPEMGGWVSAYGKIDKIVHILLFAFLIWVTINFLKYKLNKYYRVYVMLVCAGFGIVMEYAQQHFTTTRSFEIEDIIADCLGCLLGYACSAYLTHKYNIG